MIRKILIGRRGRNIELFKCDAINTRRTRGRLEDMKVYYIHSPSIISDTVCYIVCYFRFEMCPNKPQSPDTFRRRAPPKLQQAVNLRSHARLGPPLSPLYVYTRVCVRDFRAHQPVLLPGGRHWVTLRVNPQSQLPREPR